MFGIYRYISRYAYSTNPKNKLIYEFFNSLSSPILFEMAFLLSGKLFLINYFHFKMLSRTLLEVSSTQLFAPTCKITVLGTFCSKGLRLLRMSSNYVSRQNLVVTWCWLVNRPSSIHEIRESPVINTASLGHFCELELCRDVTVCHCIQVLIP